MGKLRSRAPIHQASQHYAVAVSLPPPLRAHHIPPHNNQVVVSGIPWAFCHRFHLSCIMTLPEVNGFYWNCPRWVNLHDLSKKHLQSSQVWDEEEKASIFSGLSWLTVFSLCLAELSFFMELEPGIWKCPQCQECASYFQLKSTYLANILGSCGPHAPHLHASWASGVSLFLHLLNMLHYAAP